NDFYKNDLKSLISGYKRALITPEILKQVLTDNQAFMDKANALLAELFEEGFKLSKSKMPLFERLAHDSAALPDIKSDLVVPLKELWSEELEQAVSLTQEQNRTSPIREWKEKWLEKDDQGRFVVVSPKLMRKQVAFIDVFSRYNQLLSKQGLFDYDDMIMLAINALGSNPDLKYTLQEKYLYVQLDEFQDTNEAQLKLVELLADSPLNESRPNILAVGDDDQAIYSFQGAHYSHMERFLSTYRGVTLIGLKQNYRSTSDIINLSKGIRDQISDGLSLISKQQDSVAKVTPKALVERVELNKDLEALAWVAKYISKLIKDGSEANDIAVFAPKHQLLLNLIPFLHAQN
ncbi:MAG: UvrD-helicase domain-containing protein, partial [Candidatus Saccharimonadales bacterium]